MVESSALPNNPKIFESRLSVSIAHWKEKGARGVWIKVPKSKADLIPVCVNNSFDFHHAEPEMRGSKSDEEGYVMMTRWLPTSEESPLPPNASTQIGIGSVVCSPSGKVLLVQEGAGHLKGKNVWKIPTGLLEAGEDIADGAEREVFEETNVKAVFEKVVGFRHMHNVSFGKSDLFFVCILRCSEEEARDGNLQLQKSEIAAAKWGDFGEFLQQAPYPRDMPLWNKLYSLCVGGAKGIVGDVRGLQMERKDARNPLRPRPGAPDDVAIYYRGDD